MITAEHVHEEGDNSVYLNSPFDLYHGGCSTGATGYVGQPPYGWCPATSCQS